MKLILSFLFISLTVLTGAHSSFAQHSSKAGPGIRTIIADILMVDGDFYVVRTEYGEIQIEVKPDTKVSEQFKFGDRIKAVIRPNDSAISVERAQEGEEVGVFVQKPQEPDKKAKKPDKKAAEAKSAKKSSKATAPKQAATRIVVADILMVDGDFYVVRTEYGEIQIEVTPDTKRSEEFKFGDKIKARILPNDRALSIQRAKPEDPVGVVTEKPRTTLEKVDIPGAQPESGAEKEKETSSAKVEGKGEGYAPGTRIIVAEILMVDGDFYVVRSEYGEIQIEVTPDTKRNEEFKFGDKIKAVVLKNDRALSVERADANEPIGIKIAK